MFEMDRLERPLVNLPLLKDPSTYIPDTVDLTDDAMARKYWLTCFEEALDGVNIRGVVPTNGSHTYKIFMWTNMFNQQNIPVYQTYCK